MAILYLQQQWNWVWVLKMWKSPILPWHLRENTERKILKREYNNRTVHDCFNDPFTFYGIIPPLNLPPIPIDDSPHSNKRSRYTSATSPAAIYVTSGKSNIKCTTPSDHQKVLLLSYDDPDTQHTIMSDNTCSGRTTRGY